METQDRKRLNQSGHEGHSEVHLCHKCGWPFPNPHPSARHRRAHKRVCGTIEGYKLNLDGSDGGHVSDDDSTSDKAIERTISRKSSSGVGGSRSSRSTRSEDEVFADAVNEFVDGMGSDGVMSRDNSLQNITENDSEGFKPALEDAIGDDSSASSIVLEDKQLEIIQTIEGKKEVKCGILSQDQISGSITDPAPISASLSGGSEPAVEQNLTQSSGASSVLDTGGKEHKEIADNVSEVRIPFNETAEDVSEQVSALMGMNEEFSDSLSGDGTAKLTEMQSTGLDRVEGSHPVDSPEKFDQFLNQVQDVYTTDQNAGKSFGFVEERDPKVEGNYNGDVQDVSDALLVQAHLEIAPEDLHQKDGKFNRSMAVEVPSSVESMEERLKQEGGQSKHKAEEDTVGGADHISVLKASFGDTSGLRSEEVGEEIRDELWEDQDVSSIEERKSSVSLEKVFPEVTSTDGNHDETTCVYGGPNAMDAVGDDEEHPVMHEDESSKVSVGELPVTSSKLVECLVDDILSQAKKPMNASDTNGVGNVEKFGVDEMTAGLKDENKSLDVEPTTGFGSIVAVSNDNTGEEVKSVKIDDHDKVDKIIDSNNLTAGHSQLGNGLTSKDVIETQNASESVGCGECMNRFHTGPVVNSDDSFDLKLKMSKDSTSDCPSGTAAVGSCTEKFVEHASDTDSDKIIKQHIAVSAVDITKPSGQNDRQENNSPYVPVGSAMLGMFPAHTAVLNGSQTIAEPQAVNIELRAVDKVQYSESRTPIEPLGLGKTDDISEIQIFENQKETPLKTLLVEAIAKSREESPNYNDLPAKNPNPEASKGEVGNEWNSPARYPVKIKTEKKRAKSKSSYWVPFLCCSSSSVNAHGP